MTHRTRTILFIIFILIFFILTPLILLRASGYIINLTWPIKINTAIQKTGSLHINSSPQGAFLFINNQSEQKFINKYFFFNNKNIIQTPAKIKNITPGEYNIRLEKNGYWPWEKKLNIEPGQTTFAEDIILFKKDIPILIKNSHILKISTSPNKQYLALLSDKLYIIDTENDEIISNFEINEQLSSSKDRQEMEWSPDSQKLIFGHKIFNINKNQNIDLEKYLGLNSYNIKWNKKNNDVIYFQNDNFLSEYNIQNNTIKKIIDNEKILDYFYKDNNIIFISEINDTQKLKVFSLHDQKIIIDTEIPFSNYYRFINQDNHFVNLYNEKYEILYIIDPFSAINPLKEIINNIKYSQWVNDTKILYANDFEIWILDLDANQRKLITRISQSINSLVWHTSNNYIIYASSNNINVIELDDREKRNVTEITHLENIKNINLDKKGKILYFNAKIGQQEGLYKIYIQ